MSSGTRLLIYVVCYNAELHIEETLSRIPMEWLSEHDYEILIGDDASHDRTIAICERFALNHPELNICVSANEHNLGYGGNQKKGYLYALKHNFDFVILLHGDGQYAPEYLPKMVEPLFTSQAEVVLGSRMKNKWKALQGGMPLYKWIGNQVLTFIQNQILRTSLSEFHTGYRAYSTRALMSIPLMQNSDYFDFDSEIIIQLLDSGNRIKEIEIPTFYGDEISYVNGFKYAWLILKTTIISRLCAKGWRNDRRFNYTNVISERPSSQFSK